ncbi:MAG: response regulator [Methanobacteriota archaeon]|nr:MAG: response regulator [Euryarchaeota archaeon]
MAKILIVDDEENIVILTSRIPKRNGYAVVAATDGSECLRILEQEKPDLILLDVMMPGDDGWVICRKIKENKKTRDIPVAMFTVRTSEDSVERSLECAEAQIDKPFKSEELLSVVRRLLKE